MQPRKLSPHFPPEGNPNKPFCNSSEQFSALFRRVQAALLLLCLFFPSLFSLEHYNFFLILKTTARILYWHCKIQGYNLALNPNPCRELKESNYEKNEDLSSADRAVCLWIAIFLLQISVLWARLLQSPPNSFCQFMP